METPSQLATAAVTETVTDTRGRVIVVRKLKSIDRLRFFEIIGGANAENQAYIGISIYAYSVVSIDGQPQPTITSKLALEAMVQLLDDEGVNAIADAFVKLYSETPEQAKEEVKN